MLKEFSLQLVQPGNLVTEVDKINEAGLVLSAEYAWASLLLCA